MAMKIAPRTTPRDRLEASHRTTVIFASGERIGIYANEDRGINGRFLSKQRAAEIRQRLVDLRTVELRGAIREYTDIGPLIGEPDPPPRVLNMGVCCIEERGLDRVVLYS